MFLTDNTRLKALHFAILLLSLMMVQDLVAQGDYFISPVDHKLVLAGSFGELRGNHFHSGIDIKSSNGSSGDTIRAAASGKVSRIKIEYGGYGRALYIDHPNGLTTVYAHVKKFNAKIEAYLLSQQRNAQSYRLDISLDTMIIAVKQGEFIALMGNEGRSYGPHLHFEIRNTISEKPINPFLHNIKPRDSKAPVISHLYINSLDPDGQILERAAISKRQDSISIGAWRVGLAFNGHDSMDGASNKNGIHSIKVFVDDKLAYQAALDSFSFDESSQIKGITDYQFKKDKNITLYQCYVLPNVDISIIRNHKRNKGIIPLYKDKYQKVTLVLEDYEKNTTSRNIWIKRSENMKEISSKPYNILLHYDQENLISTPSFQLKIPQKALIKKERIQYTFNQDPINLEQNNLEIGKNNIPLLKYASLTMSIPLSFREIDKIILVNSDKGVSYGGEIEDHVLSCRIDEFGSYHLALDTIAPTILTLKKNTWRKNELIKLKLSDNYPTKGIARSIDYDCYINDIWVPGAYKSMTQILKIDLGQLKLKKSNQLRIVATDDRDNTTERIISF